MLTRTPRGTAKGSSDRDDLLARGVMLWRCIADDFEQAILVGKHENGSKLPAESEIAGRYGVNRHTVRRAMAELAARGLVRTERGSGTFVKTDKLNYPISQRMKFSEIVTAAGHEAEGRLQGHRHEAANEDVARDLGIKLGDEVVRLEILRAADGVPISVSTTWLPADRYHEAAKIFRRVRSITRMLEHFGVKSYRRKWTRISAGFTDAVDAGRLRLSVHRPILIVEGLNVTDNDEPIMLVRGRFSADRVALVVES